MSCIFCTNIITTHFPTKIAGNLPSLELYTHIVGKVPNHLLSLEGLDPKLPSPWILDLDSEQQQFHWKKVAENVFSSAILAFLVCFFVEWLVVTFFCSFEQAQEDDTLCLPKIRNCPPAFFTDNADETKRTKTKTLPKPRSNRRKLKWKDCWRKCTDFVTKFRNRVRSLKPRDPEEFSCWKGRV